MTDKEIMQMLEKASIDDMYRECSSCDFYKSTWCDGDDGVCKERLAINALDLIKKQQAEIKMLKTENERVKTNIYKMAIDKALAEKARAEAIKEFADRLKSKTVKMMQYDEGGWGCEIYIVRTNDIDNLVKEMVGGADNV